MKLGMIHQWCGECFDYVKGKGLSFIEICRNYDPETEEFIAHADEIKGHVERTGVTIASVGRWNDAITIRKSVCSATIPLPWSISPAYWRKRANGI